MHRPGGYGQHPMSGPHQYNSMPPPQQTYLPHRPAENSIPPINTIFHQQPHMQSSHVSSPAPPSSQGPSPHALQPGHMQALRLHDQPRIPYMPEREMIGSPMHRQEQYNMGHYSQHGGMTMGPPVTHSALQAQGVNKRAYRQRRKDPSCDACRERKVKCDATETSSCSECTGRSVKCQFTKDTNRRMSSIKQVQDLEKQLETARKELTTLKATKTDDILHEEDEEEIEEEDDRTKKVKKFQKGHFNKVARMVDLKGHGVIQPPIYGEFYGVTPCDPEMIHEVPPRTVGDRLLEDYHTLLGIAFPMIPWPVFTAQFERVYKERSMQSVSKEWCAVLFAVLACGCLRTNPKDGFKYFEVAKRNLDLWSNEPSMDKIRANILMAIFCVETNARSAGFNILAHAVRTAQDMGLHHRLSTSVSPEEDMRCNLWWCVYATERTLSLELGRPTILDVEERERATQPWEEKETNADGMPLPHQSQDTQFRDITQTAHCVSLIQKACRQDVIPSYTLDAVDEQIDRCMSSFPRHHQLDVDDWLHPGPTAPVIYVLNMRLLLHRHNLSPASPPKIRRAAIDNCISAAKDTTHMLRRIMRDPGHAIQPGSGWRQQLRLCSSAFMCTHVWRCVLILACTGDYESATTCAQALAAIGDHRAINLACGRFLEFVLQILDAKSPLDRLPLHEDDEILAYASGDLQSDLDQAWIWIDNVGTLRSREALSPAPSAGDSSNPSPGMKHNSPTIPINNGLTNAERIFSATNNDHWDDWDGILSQLEKLSIDQADATNKVLTKRDSRTGLGLMNGNAGPSDEKSQSKVIVSETVVGPVKLNTTNLSRMSINALI